MREAPVPRHQRSAPQHYHINVAWLPMQYACCNGECFQSAGTANSVTQAEVLPGLLSEQRLRQILTCSTLQLTSQTPLSAIASFNLLMPVTHRCCMSWKVRIVRQLVQPESEGEQDSLQAAPQLLPGQVPVRPHRQSSLSFLLPQMFPILLHHCHCPPLRHLWRRHGLARPGLLPYP